MSGFTLAGEVERALASGFDGHIGKPIDASDRIDAVDDAARRHLR